MIQTTEVHEDGVSVFAPVGGQTIVLPPKFVSFTPENPGFVQNTGSGILRVLSIEEELIAVIPPQQTRYVYICDGRLVSNTKDPRSPVALRDPDKFLPTFGAILALIILTIGAVLVMQMKQQHHAEFDIEKSWPEKTLKKLYPSTYGSAMISENRVTTQF